MRFSVVKDFIQLVIHLGFFLVGVIYLIGNYILKLTVWLIGYHPWTGDWSRYNHNMNDKILLLLFFPRSFLLVGLGFFILEIIRIFAG